MLLLEFNLEYINKLCKEAVSKLKLTLKITFLFYVEITHTKILEFKLKIEFTNLLIQMTKSFLFQEILEVEKVFGFG